MGQRRRIDNIDDEIDKGPPSAGRTGTDRDPIGVDEDYLVPVPIDTRDHLTARAAPSWAASGYPIFREQGPRYSEGDEWKPAGGMSPEAIAELQRDMVAAGLIAPDARVRLGVWDETSRDAFKTLLGYANATGLSWDLALRRYAQGVPVVAGAESGEFQAPAFEVRTTNSDDLRKVFRTAVIDTLGQGWSQAQIDELVSAYQWREIQVQKSAYDREVARLTSEFYGQPDPTAGETIVAEDVPSPTVFLDTELQRRDPVGYQAGQIVNDVIPQFMQMMDGWSA